MAKVQIFFVWYYVFSFFVQKAYQGICKQTPGQLSTPSFVSEWYSVIARNQAKSLISIHHDLAEYPALVDVQIKVHDTGTGEDYIFSGIGSAQRDDDFNYKYGGVIYKYNNEEILLSTPFDFNGKTVSYVVYTGSPTLFTGPAEVTGSYIQGKVRVRLWRKSDMPAKVFNTSIFMNASSNFANIPHGLGYYPTFVTVQTMMTDGYISDGLGAVSTLDHYSIYNGIGGVLYGYDDSHVRLWTPKCPLNGYCDHIGVFFGSDGYSLGLSNNGTIYITGWQIDYGSLAYSKTFVAGKGTNNEDTIEFPLNYDTENHYMLVQVFNNEGNNAGMIFNGIGSTMPSGKSEYGGVIYAYTSKKVLIWRPTDASPKGNIVNIGKWWGSGQSAQKSTTAYVNIRVFKLQAKEILCSPIKSMNQINDIIRGKFLNHAIIFSNKATSMFICADLCLRMAACASISYNALTRTCNIGEASWKQIDKPLIDNKNYVYIERTDIHMIPSADCVKNPCRNNEMFISPSLKSACITVVTCRDGIIPSNICQQNAQNGGCLKENIGKTLVNQSSEWTYGDWLLMQLSCKLSCGLC